MKKYILFLLFMVFALVATFAETKVSVTQSIRYGNGAFAVIDSPQISLNKALKEGGKVFFRYDFEIMSKGILDSDTVYIFLKFPWTEQYHVYNWTGFLKILTLSGANEASQELLKVYKNNWDQYKYKNYEEYNTLKKSIGNRPEQYFWNIAHFIFNKKNKTYSYEYEETFLGLPLILNNKKGSKAHIEFYLDLKNILDFYEEVKKENKELFTNWITDNCLSEIKIDITFHNQYETDIYYDIPKKEYVDKDGRYQSFYICFSDIYTWKNESSASNRSFTILVSE
ncbi:MAG: hypothetical protein IKO57_04260 [Treponema sp.]|nr:hypothetical protein [Treponema sp.]